MLQEANEPSVAETLHDQPVKRGRGRPVGSTNKPKPPKISPEEIEALMAELAPAYVEAVLIRARAEMRARGLKTIITTKLGREALAKIEGDVVVVVETEVDARVAEAMTATVA